MITHKKLNNDFEYIEVKNSHAEAKIALQGAHLFHYKAKNKSPLLWLSELTHFEKGKAIRGGVPICFPWFGQNKNDTTLPQHGFARTSLWTLVLEEELDDGSTHIQLQLTPNDEIHKVWNYSFKLIFDIIIGSELTMALTTTNCDTKPFEITTALHSYFTVLDIDHVKIEGLEESTFHNNLDNQEYKQKGTVTIDKEVDRVYFDGSPHITLLDQNSKIELIQKGSNSLVIWNPWTEKAKHMGDMQDDGYKTMVCLETANALSDFKVVQPNESHTLKVRIRQISIK